MEAPEHWRPRAKYVNLYLQPTPLEDDGQRQRQGAVQEESASKQDRVAAAAAAESRRDLHAFVERKLRSEVVLKNASARKEARLWLGSTLGLLDASNDRRLKHRHFLPFLRSGSALHDHHELLHSVVLLVCQTKPSPTAVTHAIANTPPLSSTLAFAFAFVLALLTPALALTVSAALQVSIALQIALQASIAFALILALLAPALTLSSAFSLSFAFTLSLPTPWRWPFALSISLAAFSAFGRRPRSLSTWFDHFSYTERPQKGAAALEHYCLAERDYVWGRLVWRTGIPVSPVIAVQNRARMAELDPVASVRAMLASVPAFFASEPFQRSVEDGGFLSLDYEYFASFIEDAIRSTAAAADHRRHSTREEDRQAMDLRAALEDFVGYETLQRLCDHFLPYLDDDALFDLVHDVRDYHRHRRRDTGDARDKSIARHDDIDEEKLLQSELAQFIIVECRWDRLDDLLVANALAFFAGRLVKHLTSTDEGEELGDVILAYLEKQRLVLASRDEKASDALGHWALRRELRLLEDDRARDRDRHGDDRRERERRRRDENDDEATRRLQCRFICVEAFLLRYRLAVDFVDARSLKKIMTNEGIDFRPVYVTTEKKRRRKSKKKDKKSKTKAKKELVGWRFPAAETAGTTSTTSMATEEDEELNKKRKRRGESGDDQGTNKDDQGAVVGGLTYGVADAPGYIVGRFTRSALHWFRSHRRRV